MFAEPFESHMHINELVFMFRMISIFGEHDKQYSYTKMCYVL